MYDDYKEEKQLNEIVGGALFNKCKWFTLVDDYMFTRGL